MSIDPGHAQQVLRVALVTPLVYGVAVWMGAPLPFVSAMLFATFTLKMPAPPPFGTVVVLALLLALLPLAFAGIAGVLSQYPYLMVGFVGLVLFHAFRLQAVPKTALVGVLLQTFAIMLPIATGESEQAGGALSGAFALNGVLAVAGLYLAFALFPARRVVARPAPPAAPGDPLERTRSAAVAALVMLPAFTLLLAFNLTSAMRVLFTIAIVLVSLSRRDVRETGAESVLSALHGGRGGGGLLGALHLLAPARRRVAGHGVPRPPGGSPSLQRSASGRGRAGDPPGLGAARDRGGQHAVEDARLVPVLDHGRALRGLGARADPGDAGLAGRVTVRSRR